MTTKPKTPAVDPIFAAIAEHKAAEKAWCHSGEKLDRGDCALRDQYETATRAWRRAAARLARTKPTKPTTPAGAGALINYVRRDIGSTLGGLADWHMPALKTCAAALARMGNA